jgi:uncharacterized protein YbjT (DUF2867 family)
VQPANSGKPVSQNESSIMKIAVIGGSGLIGKKLSIELRGRGHDVVAASPSSGVNSVTGEGLDAALAGVRIVVDVTNSPSFEDKAVLVFFETSTRNLLKAEAKAEVRHHVALSIVGVDRVPDCGYYRAKVAQEKLISGSSIPHTIVRATQFFEFLGGIAQSATEGETVYLTPAKFQPVAAADVVSALAEISLAEPVNGIVEIAGPEAFSLAKLIQRYLQATQDVRKVVPDLGARYFGGLLDEGSLIPGDKAHLGHTRFEEWLEQFKRGT